ncbi:MAG: hypothetical protein R3B47_08430 [Bacteroidia bacterium]
MKGTIAFATLILASIFSVFGQNPITTYPVAADLLYHPVNPVVFGVHIAHLAVTWGWWQC